MNNSNVVIQRRVLRDSFRFPSATIHCHDSRFRCFLRLCVWMKIRDVCEFGVERSRVGLWIILCSW